ncbi:hypothetical protein EV384_3019 [Micromonospora kangleipakensis]|uniref:Uncharacterized protein n=2 Tax=Micromonospora kangleipakensis TaxID=1077942 RepID=A0A4Q8B9W0_9ACTN|nr:hypothetical protein EV384_3019 [Micromonospora kangleipakensis]
MMAGVLGMAVSLASLASVVASLMLSAGEFGRFGIQESLYLRISLLLLVFGALDAALDRVAERRVGHPAGPGRRAEPPWTSTQSG